MTQIIIFNQETGIPAVMIPSPEILSIMTIMEVAKKDVPMGKPFKIIELSDMYELQDIPQEAWIVNESELNDGFGERAL